MKTTCGGGSSSVFSSALKALRRQHVDFVDDVDLVARLDWAIAHAVDQLANVVDAGMRLAASISITSGCRSSAIACADRAVVGRARGRAGVAVGSRIVQGPRDDPRGGGLPDAAHPGQDKGMRQAVRVYGVGQGSDHGLLADQVGEGRRPVLARQHPIGRLPWLPSARRARSVMAAGLLTVPPSAGPTCDRRPSGGGGEAGTATRTRNSLRLLPSGPDRVGERSVRGQPPTALYQAPWPFRQETLRGTAVLRHFFPGIITTFSETPPQRRA